MGIVSWKVSLLDGLSSGLNPLRVGLGASSLAPGMFAIMLEGTYANILIGGAEFSRLGNARITHGFLEFQMLVGC